MENSSKTFSFNDYLKHINSEPDFSSKKADQKAIDLIKNAAVRIPAYKDFLKKNNCKVELLSDTNQLKDIPFTSKTNYIQEYKISDLCWDGDITRASSIASSSGTTGNPLFWPRHLSQDIDGARIHRQLFSKVFQTDKRKTLFINAFGLGNWIAGMYTHACVYLQSIVGHEITITSPGFIEDEVFKIVKNFSGSYDQTIIAGHPPVIRIMIENGAKIGIKWNKINLKFLGAGEGFSESFRDYIASSVGQNNIEDCFINILGSADAGLIGFETPLTINLRRQSQEKQEINLQIFNNNRLPYIYQYDPMFKYLESENEELIVTADATMPLLRYNTHDHGDLLKPKEIINYVNKKSVENWPYPIVYMYGRKTALISMLAVNIYPENIKAVVEHPKLMPLITGRFIVSKEHDEKQQPFINLIIEVKRGVERNLDLKRKITRTFVKVSRKVNSEYAQVESRFGKLMHPHVELVKFEDPIHFPAGKVRKMN